MKIDIPVLFSIVIPAYNEEANIENCLLALLNQKVNNKQSIDPDKYEIVIVDNGSNDRTRALLNDLSETNPRHRILILSEPTKGVTQARKTGIETVIKRYCTKTDTDHIILSTDADCTVHTQWAWSLYQAHLNHPKVAITVSHYIYSPRYFQTRPRLNAIITPMMYARSRINAIFGGFPDGKGFGIRAKYYQAVGGLKLFYQVVNGRFEQHPSDDWDFGIEMLAAGYPIIYVDDSIVETNPRRVNLALMDMVYGKTYGDNGVLTMKDLRMPQKSLKKDLDDEEEALLWQYSVKDFLHKYIILPVFLNQKLLLEKNVISWMGEELSRTLDRRITVIKEETRMRDYRTIHSYKTPCYRLYFEFDKHLLQRLSETIHNKFYDPIPWPGCLQQIWKEERYLSKRMKDFIYFYCEDRESGEAHNYFGNGGVF